LQKVRKIKALRAVYNFESGI